MRKTLLAVTSLFLLLNSSLPEVLAAQYDIKQMTPAIQSALSNRQARYGSLQRLKALGELGEDSRGYVKALQATSEASSLASEENADRAIIYTAIVEQNNLGPAGMAEVERVFAEVQRDKARSGDSVQLASGAWTKK